MAKTPAGVASTREIEATLDEVCVSVERVAQLARVRPNARVGRYAVGEVLGAGATGTVYRAVDTERDLPVALKVLHDFGAKRLAHFKAEFRVASGLAHPSLVTVFELVEDQGVWAIAMELVDRGELLDHVRVPRSEALGADVDFASLRRMLGGVLDGLEALHAAGILHRDLKPSNILLGRDERVRIVDFGLATLFDHAGSSASREPLVAGSPAYMAPEQATGRPLGPSADLYSLGVILYQALTGRLPFDGTTIGVLAQKTFHDAPDPALLAPDAPGDLLALTRGLLVRDPDARTSLDEARACFSSARTGMAPNVELSRDLVGRELEIASVVEAFDSSREGRARVVHVAGLSGVGKSALLRAIGRTLRRDRGALVLEGRCHELEAIPHKGFDAIIDALREALHELPPVQRDPILPDGLADAVPMFPVLEDLVPFEARVSRSLAADERMRRAREAIVRLLVAVNARTPIALVLDDAQWGDLEGARLLEAILASEIPAARLVILAYRSSEAKESALLSHMEALSPIQRTFEERHLPLHPLDQARATELVARILGDADPESLARIAEDSRGEPFLLEQLALARAAAPHVDARVEDVVILRAEGFSDEARGLLDVVCVAGAPLPERVLTEAVGARDARRALHALSAASMMRRTGAGPRALCYPYHDRIRSALAEAVRPDAARAIHRRIAAIAEPEGLLPSSALTRHFELAGDRAKAAEHAALAAAEAEASLAFDLAAAMYARTLELEPSDAARIAEARRGRARTLCIAGRCAEAGAAFLDAAREAEPFESRDLERQAAEAYLAFGLVSEALAVLEPLLEAEGMPYPKTPTEVLYRAVRTILGVRVGTLRRPRPVASRDAEAAARSDLAWSAGSGLTNIAPAQGVTLTLMSLIFALRSGDPFRIGRGLAFAGCGFAPGLVDVGERYLRWASDLAQDDDSDYLRVLHLVSDGTRGLVLGDWQRCIASSERAIAIAKRASAPTNWEVAIARAMLAAGYEGQGELRKLEASGREHLRALIERGDRITPVMILSSIGNACAGRHAGEALDEVIEEMRRLMADWTVPFSFWEIHRLRLVGLRSLCWGEPLATLALLDELWPKLEEHRSLALPLVAKPMYWVRSAAQLEAASRGLVPKGPALRDARRSARALEKAAGAETPAIAAILRASQAQQRLDSATRDAELRRAIEIARAADMRSTERMAARALALLRGEAAEVARLEAELETLGIVEPDGWACFVTPGLRP